MSEQKDEFDEFEEYCLSNLGIAKEIPIFSVNAVVIKAITRAISENLSMYQRIKRHKVCKNCAHMLDTRMEAVRHCKILGIGVKEDFYCARFKHAT